MSGKRPGATRKVITKLLAKAKDLSQSRKS